MTEAPYFPFLCCRCHQFSVPGETVRDQPSDRPLICATCLELERAPQGEAVRLFAPAANQVPGQLAL